MTTASSSSPNRDRVDTATLFAILDAVRAAPGAAHFRFRATGGGIAGTEHRRIDADPGLRAGAGSPGAPG